MVKATRREVEGWLRDEPAIDFPATKNDILDVLEQAGAPEGVVTAVRAVPPDLYGRRDEVVAAADTEPDDGRDPALQAVQQRARSRSKSRIAEPERDVALPPLHGEEQEEV